MSLAAPPAALGATAASLPQGTGSGMRRGGGVRCGQPVTSQTVRSHSVSRQSARSQSARSQAARSVTVAAVGAGGPANTNSVVLAVGTVALKKRPSLTACRAKNDNVEADPPSEDLDFITRMVVKVFGANVLDDPEPMGLKRMTKEEWPDQWPALVTEFADPLPSDDSLELKQARAVLKQTQLEIQPLGLAFDAEVHGWLASSFHAQLDGLGAALVIATAEDGTVFGGYNPKGWLGYGEWLDAISAFLFVYPKKGGAGGVPIKLAKVGGSGMAIVDEVQKGPTWGPDGLSMDLENRVAKCRLGSYYDTMPDGGKSLFGGGRSHPKP